MKNEIFISTDAFSEDSIKREKKMISSTMETTTTTGA